MARYIPFRGIHYPYYIQGVILGFNINFKQMAIKISHTTPYFLTVDDPYIPHRFPTQKHSRLSLEFIDLTIEIALFYSKMAQRIQKFKNKFSTHGKCPKTY